MQHSRPTLNSQTSYPPSAHFLFSLYHRPMSLAVLLYLLLPLPSDSLRVLQWNAGGVRAKALNFYILFGLLLLILYVSRNLTLTHLPLFGSLDSLSYDLIAPNPGLAFSLPIPRTLAAVSSFSLGRVYPSLNFLPPLFA